MLSTDALKLEKENLELRKALQSLSEKMEQNASAKPKSCQYCKYFVQHYMRDSSGISLQEYTPINAGHCTKGVPVSKGGRRKTATDGTCQFFEIGTYGLKIREVSAGANKMLNENL